MPLFSFDNLFHFADELSEPVPVAAAGGADRTVLETLRAACDRGWVAPFLVGVESDMRALAADCGIDLDGFTLVDAAEPASAAVALVRAGRARLLMKGQIATPSLMTAVLDADAGLRTGRVICQVVLMEIRPAGRRFLLADTGICIRPTLAQKADILGSAVAVAHTLAVSRPCVAVLAATEGVTELMPETRDAAALQHRNQAGEFPGCVVRGPLSFDLAYDRDAALKKNLPDADFDGSNCYEADFLDAQLKNANLRGANLKLTLLAGVRHG